MPIRQTKYLPSLDGFRGFFILCVVMTHINVSRSIITDPRITPVVNNALFGVRYFFVISGFLITTLLLKEQAATGSISLKNFYFRRTLRILPVAYSFLITMVVLNRCWHLGITSANFLASFLFFKNFRLATTGFLEHFWSLSIEEQYYLLSALRSHARTQNLSHCLFFHYRPLFCQQCTRPFPSCPATCAWRTETPYGHHFQYLPSVNHPW